MDTKNKTLVYDWPTRILHWLFTLSFIIAFTLGKTVDDDGPLFVYHISAGLTIGFVLLLRIIWGFIGTSYAHFSNYKLNPVELLRYFKNVIATKTKRYLGHNPASSYAALIMYMCAIGMVITGIIMSGFGESDFLEETHEILANLFLITAIFHVVGVLFHHFKHNDGLWSSMFDGSKNAISGKRGIRDSKKIAGILFLVLTLGWMGYLYTSYNSSAQIIDLMGKELTVGEAEHEINGESEQENKSGDKKEEGHDEDEDDDHDDE